MFESAVFILTCAFIIALAISHEKPNKTEENINGTIDSKWNTTNPEWNVVEDTQWNATKNNWDTVIPIENTTSYNTNIYTQSWNETNPTLNVTIPEGNSTSSNRNNTTVNWNFILIFPVNATTNSKKTIPEKKANESNWNTTASSWYVETFLPENTSILDDNTTITNRDKTVFPSNITNPKLNLNNTGHVRNSTFLEWSNNTENLNVTTFHPENLNIPMTSKNITNTTSNITTPSTDFFWNTTDFESNNTTSNWNVPLALLNTRVNSNKAVKKIKTTTTSNLASTSNWNYYIKLE